DGAGFHEIAAIYFGDDPARLAHNDRAGADVPCIQAALPIAIVPPGRDIGEVKGGGAEATNPGAARDHPFNFTKRLLVTGFAMERRTGSEYGFAHVGARSDT